MLAYDQWGSVVFNNCIWSAQDITSHNDVIKWRHIPRQWSFVRWPVNFPTQRPVTRSFDVFFDLHLHKRLSKQSCGWWFEMPSRSLWSHCINHATVSYEICSFYLPTAKAWSSNPILPFQINQPNFFYNSQQIDANVMHDDNIFMTNLYIRCMDFTELCDTGKVHVAEIKKKDIIQRIQSYFITSAD